MANKNMTSAAANAAAQEETTGTSDIFLTEIKIQHVRHLHDITIPLSKTERKNLILTGENGSGKSSVLEALREPLDLAQGILFDMPEINYHRERLPENMRAEVTWNVPPETVRESSLVTINIPDDRKLGDEGNSALDLESILLNMKESQKKYEAEGDDESAGQIEAFFRRFQSMLRELYENSTLNLKYHKETKTQKPHFTIQMEGREPFDFDTLARGYSAILEPIGVLMGLALITIEKDGGRDYFDFRRPCVALIDEIDAHLHLSLQKRIFPILTKLFPHVQFVVTTHSPFVLASAKNTVVYDLKHKTPAADGLSDVSYSGIVEGYFKIDEMSEKLERELDDYRALAAKNEWTVQDYMDAERLERDLDAVPGFLAGAWKTEFVSLRLKIAEDKGE